MLSKSFMFNSYIKPKHSKPISVWIMLMFGVLIAGFIGKQNVLSQELSIFILSGVFGFILFTIVWILDNSRKQAIEYAVKINRNLLETNENSKIINKDLSKANIALQKAINERKLAEKTLNIYMQKLERSNQELQDFAYVASHDLQEPLRKIITFSERLISNSDDKFSEVEMDYLFRMKSASTRMSNFINDLLSFSRVSAIDKEFFVTPLNEILDTVILDLEASIEASHAVIEISDLPSIEVDAFHMQQVFQNIISNALKFSKSNQTPIIKIYCESTKVDNFTDENFEKNSVCKIYISDNGVGFEQKYVDRIFKPFQRLHGHQYEGTGMGLAICKKIIESHNGFLDVESVPGQGSKFIITLPVRYIAGKELKNVA